ncbi:Trihelix transcription factor [Nymphaea thermarum]|nr:Trihelix transcription factor [Nymphaea thermarum]
MADPGAEMVVVVDVVGRERGREYRKGNWTLDETLALIEAKKLDDERRLRGGGQGERRQPTELRWKCVENYCWKKGCFRSQNQCNDKWDNLLRDYKKVREYEMRLVQGQGQGQASYWVMDRHERRERNLPSNLLLQIYEAVVDVVGRGSSSRTDQPKPDITLAVGKTVASGSFRAVPSYSVEHGHLPIPNSSLPALSHDPPPPQPPLLAIVISVFLHVGIFSPPGPSFHWSFFTVSFGIDTCCVMFHGRRLMASDLEGSEHSSSPSKKRKAQQKQVDNDELDTLSSAISKGASVIADTLLACEEKEEKRQRDLIHLEERRLRIEEANAEVNREGLNGLAGALAKLANSFHALTTHKKPAG